jgi:hypothetical protein
MGFARYKMECLSNCIKNSQFSTASSALRYLEIREGSGELAETLGAGSHRPDYKDHTALRSFTFENFHLLALALDAAIPH